MGTTGNVGSAGGRQQVLMHQVVYRLGDEKRSLITRDSAGGGELADFSEQLEPGMQSDGIDLGGSAVIGNLLHSGGHGQIRIPLQVTRCNHLFAYVVGIVGGELMPPVVESLTILRAAGKC